MSVGVMKDYKLKLRNLHVSHTLLDGKTGLVPVYDTLGWSWN